MNAGLWDGLCVVKRYNICVHVSLCFSVSGVLCYDTFIVSFRRELFVASSIALL